MTEWQSIRGKITKDQRGFIEKYKKKHKIPNDNQFIKHTLEEILGINVADSSKSENSKLPPEYLTVYYFYEYLKREYESSPEDQKKIEDIFKKYASPFWIIHTRKHNKKLDEANEMWDHFKTKRKIGRPKKEKSTRGRPKETGL